MIAKSILAGYLHKDMHGVTNWNGWQGRIGWYAPWHTKALHLLAKYKSQLKVVHSPMVCLSCFTVFDKDSPIYYGKVIPYCPYCKEKLSIEDDISLHVRGTLFYQVVMEALHPYYTAYQTELLISQVIIDKLYEFEWEPRLEVPCSTKK